MQRSSDRRRLPPDLSQKASLWVLAGLVVLSGVARGLGAQKVQSPWILPDELIYSDLARSFADTGQFAIRGAHTSAYSLGYPAVLGIAFLHRSPLAAYEAAKWLNAFLMSLAAVPVFFLARRLLPRGLALLAAGFALLVPSLAYTGLLMTENAYYPVFLAALLVIVRALEDPTVGRQALALAAIALSFVTRAQGIVLMPTLVLAIVLLVFGSAPRGGSRSAYWSSIGRELGRYRFTAAVVAASAASLWLVQMIRGQSVSDLLGIYAGYLHEYSVTAIPRWVVYHLVDIELYLGVLPFVPASVVAAAVLWRKGFHRDERAVAAASIAAAGCLLVFVSTIASHPIATASGYPNLPTAVHERYLFYVAPLYLLFFVCWLHRRDSFGSRAFAPLVAVAVLLPLVLPYADVHTNADFEALALLPWRNSLIGEAHVPLAMATAACIFSALLFIRRSSFALLQVGLVGIVMFVTGQIAQSEIRSASGDVASSYTHAPSWIDRAVPRGAKVAVLWHRDARWPDGATLWHEQALWKAELFNAAVSRFFFLGTAMQYDLPENPARMQGGHVLVPGSKRSYRYVLAASAMNLDGDVIGRDRKAGLVLYRLRGGA